MHHSHMSGCIGAATSLVAHLCILNTVLLHSTILLSTHAGVYDPAVCGYLHRMMKRTHFIYYTRIIQHRRTSGEPVRL
jgi:hypothetical protein